MSTLEEEIKRFKNNAEYERQHGNLQGYIKFRQLAGQLEELKTYRQSHLLESDKPSGKWIERDDGWGGTYYDCSVCEESWTTIDGTPFDNGMRYCPHCGALMIEEQGENT